MASEQEFRKAERKKLRINRIFNAEITIDNLPINCFVYIVDFSEKGLKIHTDFPVPENKIILLKLLLGKPILEINAKRIWQKELLGGMYVVGLEWVEVSENKRNELTNFMYKYSPEGRRKAFRFNKVLAIEIKTPNLDEASYALTTNLSPRGMQILFPEQLPKETSLLIKLMLDFNKPPVEMTAKVVWDKITSWGEYFTGLEFTQISTEDSNRVNSFIEESFLEAAVSGGEEKVEAES